MSQLHSVVTGLTNKKNIQKLPENTKRVKKNLKPRQYRLVLMAVYSKVVRVNIYVKGNYHNLYDTYWPLKMNEVF